MITLFWAAHYWNQNCALRQNLSEESHAIFVLGEITFFTLVREDEQLINRISFCGKIENGKRFDERKPIFPEHCTGCVTHLLGERGRLVAAQLQKIPEFLERGGDQGNWVYLLPLLTLPQIHHELCLCGTNETWRSDNSYYTVSRASGGKTVKLESTCWVYLMGKSKWGCTRWRGTGQHTRQQRDHPWMYQPGGTAVCQGQRSEQTAEIETQERTEKEALLLNCRSVNQGGRTSGFVYHWLQTWWSLWTWPG